MIILDTNILIRFFTQDDLKKSRQVRKLLESSNSLYIPEVVFPELEYVLQGHYKTSRKKIATIFQFLLAQKNIQAAPVLNRAFSLYLSSKLDMADCIVAAYSNSSTKNSLASFDKELLEEVVRHYRW